MVKHDPNKGKWFIVSFLVSFVLLLLSGSCNGSEAEAALPVLFNNISAEKPCPDTDPLCFKVLLPTVHKPLPPPCEEPVVETYRHSDGNEERLYIRFYVEKCPGMLDIKSNQPDLAHRVNLYPSWIVWEITNHGWWWLEDDNDLCRGLWSHELIVRNNKEEKITVKLITYGEVIWQKQYQVWTNSPPSNTVPPAPCQIP